MGRTVFCWSMSKMADALSQQAVDMAAKHGRGACRTPGFLFNRDGKLLMIWAKRAFPEAILSRPLAEFGGGQWGHFRWRLARK